MIIVAIFDVSISYVSHVLVVFLVCWHVMSPCNFTDV